MATSSSNPAFERDGTKGRTPPTLRLGTSYKTICTGKLLCGALLEALAYLVDRSSRLCCGRPALHPVRL
ncbi:MAG: hypothetical protein ORN21_03520, partial [Methylophilaceae bacterium]|nr:hypothetical protein [Methylophilaceae bacterium]